MWHAFERLLDLVAPRRCLGCNSVGAAAWCAACGPPREATENRPVLGVPVLALGAYDGALAQAIRRFKYEPRPELAARFALALSTKARELELVRGSALVPIPLFPQRLVERGFNQSALLASALAPLLGCSHLPRLLERVRETGRQADLRGRERAADVEGAFTLRGRAPRRVVLVDDVVTTGATCAACVKVLEELEVNVVAILALARTQSGREPATSDFLARPPNAHVR